MGSILVGVGDRPGHPDDPVMLDITKAPHVLVAGMTGSGKSVLMHSMLTEILLCYPPGDVSLVLIDPKIVEFSRYAGVPHLQVPPIDDVEYAIKILGWAADVEMMLRFEKMSRLGVRDVDQLPPGEGFARMLIVIDELANLILSSKQVEPHVVRIATMGRAAGIHMILATQRPSADVLTGLIRANVPTRLCLGVVNTTESRIMLDENGAEKLKTGEILARLPGDRKLTKLIGRFTNDADIDEAVKAWAA